MHLFRNFCFGKRAKFRPFWRILRFPGYRPLKVLTIQILHITCLLHRGAYWPPPRVPSLSDNMLAFSPLRCPCEIMYISVNKFLIFLKILVILSKNDPSGTFKISFVFMYLAPFRSANETNVEILRISKILTPFHKHLLKDLRLFSRISHGFRDIVYRNF